MFASPILIGLSSNLLATEVLLTPPPSAPPPPLPSPRRQLLASSYVTYQPSICRTVIDIPLHVSSRRKSVYYLLDKHRSLESVTTIHRWRTQMCVRGRNDNILSSVDSIIVF